MAEGERARHAYGFGREVDHDFETAERRVTEALQAEGFGVLTSIDVQATLKEKLGIDDFRPYVILGACNPHLAHRAFAAEPDIGLLLPCNVVIYEREGGTRIAAMNPMTAMGLVGNPHMEPVAREADEKLRRALEAV